MRKYLLFLLGFLLFVFFLLLAGVVFIAFWCDEPGRWPEEKFDKVLWIEAEESDRYKWARDIVENHLLDGKTEQQIVELLGVPSSKYGGRISYVIKIGGSCLDQVYALIIIFDEDDIVSNYFILGD